MIADTKVRPQSRWQRLSDREALELYFDASIHELGRRAYERLMQMHPEPYRTYVVDRNINYANVCTAKCIFCNFKADPGADDAYILSYEQIGRKIEELIEIGGTQILMQGGLVPDASHPSGHGLPFEWYLELLRFIKRNYPQIHIHAFSPPEIWAFHEVYRMPLREVLVRLRDAGLDTIPGGGGEILVDRVRRRIGQGKATTQQWLAVMREAHRLGMKTSCTMMIGHIETIEERIEHMRLLRELQDETGGFIAFIHWPFQPEGTPLGRWKPLPLGPSDEATERRSDEGEGTEARKGPGRRGQGAGTRGESRGTPPAPVASGLRGGQPPSAGDPPSSVASGLRARRAFDIRPSSFDIRSLRPRNDGQHLLLADAHEYLVMLAIARLYFDNIPNIQSSWVTMGPKIGQLALFYGANDMGSVMMEENVVSAAGTTYRLNEDEIRRLITDAGWQPQQRDQYYRPIDPPRRRTPLPVA